MKLDGTELYHAISHQLERSFKDELELAEDDASAEGGNHDEEDIASKFDASKKYLLDHQPGLSRPIGQPIKQPP